MTQLPEQPVKRRKMKSRSKNEIGSNTYSQETNMKRQGLHNPAVVAAIASSPEGQKAIAKTLENANQGVNATVSIVKGVLKMSLFLGVGYFAYKKIFLGFSPLRENKRDKPSNISTGMARNKAEAIFSAMYGVGNGFKSVKQNLIGVNPNGFVRIHNQFGLRKGINPFSNKMTLIEWFTDQFSQNELMELRFLIPNFF
ncbi:MULTISPECIES: hypothetical protein [unclassified Flavobacterium]|uniref:hypothetical protein n=1 Tax=unclassified Flavobacterium TaxID=196869 RepID=UPI001ACA23FB|nr:MULTISPECIES: hypothetical protein [unclassified Flavobacterium]MBN9285578.1 hypothetical protein [Flavobacterium sp.]